MEVLPRGSTSPYFGTAESFWGGFTRSHNNINVYTVGIEMVLLNISVIGSHTERHVIGVAARSKST